MTKRSPRRPLTAYSTSAEQTKQLIISTDLNRFERLEIRDEFATQNAHRRICMDVRELANRGSGVR